MHDHPVGHQCAAGNDELWHFLDFYKAHATVAGNTKLRVPAEMRHFDAVLPGGFDDHLSL